MTALPAHDWNQRWQCIVDKVRRIESEAGRVALMNELGSVSRPLTLAFVNAHAMNTLAASQEFFDALASADLLLRDGSGMATLFTLLGCPPGLNLNGTDLIPNIIERYNGRQIALYGTSERYVDRACDGVRQLTPDSELSRAHGFLSADDYIELALAAKPELIVLGMGMPKQERVAQLLRAALKVPCLIVCGGAILDFLGARVSRAPKLMRKAGAEWLYRLAREPRRLFARYVLGNPLFLCRAVKFVRTQRKTALVRTR